MQRVQTNFIRLVFKHSFSPNIESCHVLLVVPPIDILSSSINVKFLIKVKLPNDLLTAAYDSSVLRQKSVANSLGSHLRRFVKLVNNDTRSYTVDNINNLNELLWRRRWTASDKNSFFSENSNKCHQRADRCYIPPVKTDKCWDVVQGSTLVDYISQSMTLNINEE